MRWLKNKFLVQGRSTLGRVPINLCMHVQCIPVRITYTPPSIARAV